MGPPAEGVTPPALALHAVTTGPIRAPGLRNVSLTVPAGSISAVIGPSAEHHSELLHLVAGIIIPTQGTVRLGPAGIAPRSAAGRALSAYLAGDVRLDPAMRVQGFLRYYGAFYSQLRLETARDYLDLWEIPLDANIAGLSRSRVVLVALAALLSRRPALLLLDELTQGLDPEHQDMVLRTVAEHVAVTGATVLSATHRLEEAERFADRIIVIDDGRIVLTADLDDIKASWCRIRIVGIERWDLPLPPGVMRTEREGSAMSLIVADDAPGVALQLIERGATFAETEHLTLREIYGTLLGRADS